MYLSDQAKTITNDALQLIEQHTQLMEDVEREKKAAYEKLNQGYEQQAVSIIKSTRALNKRQ